MPISFFVDAAQFIGAVDLLQGYPRRQIQVTAQHLDRLGDALAQNLRLNTPVGATGDLAESTSHVIHIRNDEVSVDIIQPAEDPSGFIYQDKVSLGRPGGLGPPVDRLQGWVELKWGVDPDESLQVAFRLASHIAQHGTQPNNYVLDTVQESQAIIEETARQLGIGLAVAVWDIGGSPEF